MEDLDNDIEWGKGFVAGLVVMAIAIVLVLIGIAIGYSMGT